MKFINCVTIVIVILLGVIQSYGCHTVSLLHSGSIIVNTYRTYRNNYLKSTCLIFVIMDDSISENFEEAASTVRTLASHLPPDRLLYLYARYKQV